MNSTNELLLKSYDGELTTEEQQVLNDALRKDDRLRQEKKELDDLRDQLAHYNPMFSNYFAENVMDNISPTIIQKDFAQLFKVLAMSGVAAILVILITIYFTDGSLGVDALYGLSGYTPDQELFTFLNY